MSALDDAPHTVYVHLAADGRVLYVGCTTDTPQTRPEHGSGVV